MNIKEIGKKAIVPCTSALLGAVAVVAFLKLSPVVQAKAGGSVKPDQLEEQVYDDIFKKHESIQRQFESLFKDDLFGENDSSKSNPFDSWFSEKFGGDTVNNISKREDENFVYYDIKVGDLSSSSINTKVEKGYISISGTEEKKTGAEGKDGNNTAQSIFKSSFSRTFPLPNNVDQEKMQMLTEKDKVILKFPKTKA